KCDWSSDVCSSDLVCVCVCVCVWGHGQTCVSHIQYVDASVCGCECVRDSVLLRWRGMCQCEEISDVDACVCVRLCVCGGLRCCVRCVWRENIHEEYMCVCAYVYVCLCLSVNVCKNKTVCVCVCVCV